MQQAVRGNARRNRSSRPPQEKTALHPPVPRQSNFPNTLRLGDTREPFSGVRGPPGSRRCWRSATHSSRPTVLHAVDGVGVARHRGRRAGRGRPYPRRSPPPRRRCGRQPLAGAHRQCPREKPTRHGGRAIGRRSQARHHHHIPAGGTCPIASPAQKRKSCGNCQPYIEPLLGGRQISRSGKLRLRKAEALDAEASRIEQGAPRRLLAAKRPVRFAGESDVPSRRRLALRK